VAIVGHPNAGKSSIVATLTENDRIEIDQRSGTTLTSDAYPVRIDDRIVITFIDTPGFQNPRHILEWFQSHADAPNLGAAFIASHADDPLFSHDCSLLQPLADGAGVILVVDGSRRIKEKDRVELELLRLSGRPRMAILNNLSAEERHLDAWHDALNKYFNVVRLFNAHRATYEERIALLNALKVIDQRWEPMLEETIQALEQDWERRIHNTARIIIAMLRRALSHQVSKAAKIDEADPDSQRQQIAEELTDVLREQLRRFETATRAEIRAQFRHNVWDLPPGSLLEKDLFAEDVEQALGLQRSQMIATGIATGAITGGALDLALAGLALGTGTVIGGILGGALGYFGSTTLGKMDIRGALGYETFSMGPVNNPRFPFVLLDRILLYCALAMNWSHGRQAADETAPNPVPDRTPKIKQGFTVDLVRKDQMILAKFFATARRSKTGRHEQEACIIIERLLRELSHNDVDRRTAV
jgi:small GTP-binding protein